jgi:hypothetical protein
LRCLLWEKFISFIQLESDADVDLRHTKIENEIPKAGGVVERYELDPENTKFEGERKEVIGIVIRAMISAGQVLVSLKSSKSDCKLWVGFTRSRILFVTIQMAQPVVQLPSKRPA